MTCYVFRTLENSPNDAASICERTASITRAVLGQSVFKRLLRFLWRRRAHRHCVVRIITADRHERRLTIAAFSEEQRSELLRIPTGEQLASALADSDFLLGTFSTAACSRFVNTNFTTKCYCRRADYLLCSLPSAWYLVLSLLWVQPLINFPIGLLG